MLSSQVVNDNGKRYRQTSLFDCFIKNKIPKINPSQSSTAAAEIVEGNTSTKETVEMKNSEDQNNESSLLEDIEMSTPSCSQNSEDLFPESSPKEEFTSNKEMFYPLRLKIKPSSQHVVMFKVSRENWVEGQIPAPHPTHFHDVWDSDHVRMPCSNQNVYPVNGELIDRWELITKSLSNPIKSSYDIEEAILTYNAQYSKQWDFKGLHYFFKNTVTPEEAAKFLDFTIPEMIKLALSLPKLCTQSVPLLKTQVNCALSMTQHQIACLLANAFFCTYPRRNAAARKKNNKPTEFSNYPDINFQRLYNSSKFGLSQRQMKLKSLFHYFNRVLTKMPSGTVTFHRQCFGSFPKWSETNPLTNFVAFSQGLIETKGKGMLQVDFANKFVGGGVIGSGCVQEEIRFIICPELLITRLFTEVLGSNEVLLIKGCEQFSEYAGYGNTFAWDGDFEDLNLRDESGRLQVELVAMDAVHYRSEAAQYLMSFIRRELNKAYCGFCEPFVGKPLTPVATGNWGCGAFRGSPHLKALLQWMAASIIGREVMYFTFSNDKLKKELQLMAKVLSDHSSTVGDVWLLLNKFSKAKASDASLQLFPFIYKTLKVPDCDTEVEPSLSPIEDHTVMETDDALN